MDEDCNVVEAVAGGSICASVIQVGRDPDGASYPINDVNVILKSPHLMPKEASDPITGSYLHRSSRLKATIVHLQGTAYERGYAHGLMLAPQIMDMVNLFLLEDRVQSLAFYQEEMIPTLGAQVRLTPQLEDGIKGMLAGMRASNHSLLTPLAREVEAVDLVALNSYETALATTAGGSSAGAEVQGMAGVAGPGPSSCSQFVFWGDAVSQEELRGGTIAGRNMDGENDLRKLTVNNFVIFVEKPSEDGLQPIVHFMWPGFLTVSSGFNAQGRYLMENSGCNPPGRPSMFMPLKRDVIHHLLLNSSLPADISPGDMEQAILDYRGQEGGSCSDGCLFVHALPYQASSDPNLTAGFVYEGDRYGGMMRRPNEVAPHTSQGIMVTNHYFKYHASELDPLHCNGIEASFSSLARYFTGSSKVAAWTRLPGGLGVGSREMKELLQSVDHGTTEHSVIFKPNDMSFEVAVASPNGLWDAAYDHW
eukprot:CAMPEP_0197866158 /NCGR_PEP_ID=MMETSP1438-20131217/44063_1 /TAXON_ID=1461541 /ORGANISM="Pterosperma sp., Strain CCMP1384" /LENGTH=477 /DNA_ID=CAMNT_0043484705 /DNA_START=1151 /DNA_END=2581 /DNA_ORIENTATION=-